MNRREFLGAVRRTRVFDADKYQALVLGPVLRALGLEGALPRAPAPSTP